MRFFAVVFFGNSPEIGRDRKGRQKNLVFPGISCDFVVGNRCFCYCFALILFAPLSFFPQEN